MRTPESKIRQSILHPEEEVRLAAVGYFRHACGQDDTVMPLVIEAVEKYGRAKAFRMLRAADELPQTERSIHWLTGELAKDWNLDDVEQDNYCSAVALVLCGARTGLLKPEFAELPFFPEELHTAFRDRLEMAGWDWETGWAALEAVGEAARERGDYRRADLARGARIVESMARHPEKGDVLLPLLHRRYRGRERNLMEWIEPLLIDLAGKMRLEEAVPILVERLHEDDLDTSDSGIEALAAINGDGVVRTIADHWPDGNQEFRTSAASVLEYVHTELKVEKCLEFLATEEENTKDFLVHALLASFADEAIEPALGVVPGDWDDLTPDGTDLRYRLVAAATVMGVSFPEYPAWYEHAVQHNWGWHDHERGRIRENLDEDEANDEEWDEDDWDDEEWDEEECDEEEWDEESEDDFGADRGDFEEEPYRVVPNRREPEPARRNDPCPCGSGKKYKKCCMKQGQSSSQEAPPRFPIGTIAFYGPDDMKTTKICASVIRREGAEPMLQRWVGSKVKDDPKVRREMLDFFKRHGVQSVVASDGNMGCPHEEGKDFPRGGDCPFCPWWKGKQGSGARP
jgi:hypothetical protein